MALLFQYLLLILLLLLLLLSCLANAQQCTIVGCCLDDCCHEGTFWHVESEYCLPNPLEKGFNGTYTSNYTEGCMSRTCCGKSCCGHGTRYNLEVEACVPVDISTIEVDFTLAAPDNVMFLESLHYKGDTPTLQVSVEEDAKVFALEGENVFAYLGQGGDECPPQGALEITPSNNNDDNFITISLNGQDTVVYVCANGVLVGRCIHVYAENPNYVNINFRGASIDNFVRLQYQYLYTFLHGRGYGGISGCNRDEDCRLYFELGGASGGGSSSSLSTLASGGDSCPPEGTMSLENDANLTLFLVEGNAVIYACQNGVVVGRCVFRSGPVRPGISNSPSLAPSLDGTFSSSPSPTSAAILVSQMPSGVPTRPPVDDDDSQEPSFGPGGVGHLCETSEECVNGACGFEFFNNDDENAMICCPSSKTERIPNGKIYCTGQAVGNACGTNTQCASGVCVFGVCLAEKQQAGQACDAIDNDDCLNGACGFEFFDTESAMICCPSNETERIPNRQRDGKIYCTGQGIGEACGSNSQCSSGICQDAVCVEQESTAAPSASSNASISPVVTPEIPPPTLDLTSQGDTNQGTDFWVLETPTFSCLNNSFAIAIANPSDETATVVIEHPATNSNRTLVIPAGNLTNSRFPCRAISGMGNSIGIPPVYRISSNVNVVAYAFVEFGANSDASLLLPVQALGMTYRVGSYKHPTNSLDAIMGVVAVEDDTSVSFFDSSGALVGSRVVLEQGQALQRRQEGDMTGWSIVSDKPVAAFSGNVCTSVGDGFAGCDALYEQLLPEESLASEATTSTQAASTSTQAAAIAPETTTSTQEATTSTSTQEATTSTQEPPTPQPTRAPTPTPTEPPTPPPTPQPTRAPTPNPTEPPTPSPTLQPTRTLTPNPSEPSPSSENEFAWDRNCVVGPEVYDYCGKLEFCGPAPAGSFGYRQLPGGTCSSPGPVIRINNGKRYLLTLVNNVPGTTTNLHTHGLHISGDGNADDITRFVDFNNQLHYVWDLREGNNYGGTYWYHAHQHGATYNHVNNGALGMLIVNDDFDSLLPDGLTNANQIKRFLSNEKTIFAHYVALNSIFGTWYGNGKTDTELNIVDGEWTRFRVAVSHGNANRINVKIDPASSSDANPCVTHVLAHDGAYLNNIPGEQVPVTTVTGASRVDLAVRCVSPGAQALLRVNYFVIAKINVVAGSPMDAVPFEPGAKPGSRAPWSPNRPNYLRDLRDEVVPDSNKYNITLASDTVNDKVWDAATPLRTIQYNETQEWTIHDTGVHPFHTHLYHMQVVSPEGCGEHVYGEWYDTISSSHPCIVRFKTADFGQRMVMHCHIIQHSDKGSMGWMDVVGGPTHPNQNPGIAQEPIGTTTVQRVSSVARTGLAI